ncbi:MAG: hypothetical protein NC311_10360 [Muribaculaceae bacterium]|nr:hypothetical protein [Muribaculaceae bacterium]MCM1439439.1 hypothetical protein [Roseburia sp.]
MKLFKYKNIAIQFEENDLLNYVESHLRNNCCETGGMICGYYSENLLNATITEFCKPPKDSVFGRASFLRGIFGTKNYFEKKWKDGQYYLGDWHLHPYCSPTASCQDLRQIELNSKDKKLKCPEPIMVIVGGSDNKDMNVYIFIENEVKLCEQISV